MERKHLFIYFCATLSITVATIINGEVSINIHTIFILFQRNAVNIELNQNVEFKVSNVIIYSDGMPCYAMLLQFKQKKMFMGGVALLRRLVKNNS